MAPLIVQGHIHLSTDLGTAPENAPDVKWKVHHPGRQEQNQFFLSVSYGLTGLLQPNVLLDTVSGDPVMKKNFGYQLFIKEHDGYDIAQRLAMLEAMVGQTVYLVDVVHPADGVDHTDYVRNVFFAGLGDYPTDHVKLAFFYVDIQLLQAD